MAGMKSNNHPFRHLPMAVRASVLMLAAISTLVPATIPVAHADQPPEQRKWITFDSAPIAATRYQGPGKRSFRWNERIYARVFYDRPLKDAVALHGDDDNSKKFFFESSIPYADQTERANSGMTVPKDDQDKPYMDIEVLPDPATAKVKYEDSSIPAHLIGGAAEKNSGKVKMHFEIGSSKGFVREGDIEIDMKGADTNKLKKEREEARVSGERAQARFTPLPKVGKVHQLGVANALAQAMVKRDKNVKRARVFLTDDEWEITRHPISGAIIDRVTSAQTITEEKDSGRCILDKVGFLRQRFIGGRFEAVGSFGNTGSDEQDILCSVAFGKK
jgi:hypothetical protein